MEHLLLSAISFFIGVIILVFLVALALLVGWLVYEIWKVFTDPVLKIKLPSMPKPGVRPIVAGDVVQLKSGGPKMVALEYTDFSGWTCRWFAGNKVELMCFKPQILKRA